MHAELRQSCPWDSPGRNTGVGCHFLLQGIFPTQGLNLCLLRWQADSLPLGHLGRTVHVAPFTRAAGKALYLTEEGRQK